MIDLSEGSDTVYKKLQEYEKQNLDHDSNGKVEPFYRGQVIFENEIKIEYYRVLDFFVVRQFDKNGDIVKMNMGHDDSYYFPVCNFTKPYITDSTSFIEGEPNKKAKIKSDTIVYESPNSHFIDIFL